MLERMATQLSALRDADQLRDLKLPSGIQLNSNDYLALSSHPLLQQAILRAVEEDTRMASTGSRLLSGHHARWDELESEFAEFMGVEAALYFPTGYSANIGLLSAVLKPEDTVFSDAANHASLIDGARLARAKKVIFPHLDLDYLETAMRRDSGSGQKVIVVESIFSMDGDHAPLRMLLELCEHFDAFMIVDEAHSTGVEGASGRGSTHMAGRSDRILATVHTCGKALASMGAFVAGSRVLRDFLINQARPFIFTTAPPPYCAAHVRQALLLARQAEAERQHLRNLGEYLRAHMRAAGFDVRSSDSQIIPLIVGSNEAAVRFAMMVSEAGFDVRAIRPPTVPAGSSRLRLSLNAGLTVSDIDSLMHALVSARNPEVFSE